MRSSAAVLALAVSLAGCSHRSAETRHPEPGPAAVALVASLPRGTSTVQVSHRGARWMAATIPPGTPGGPRVHVYRWTGARWSRRADLQLRLPPADPSAVYLTGSRDPDFALRSGGADTEYLDVVSYVGGAWHLVPWDRDGLTTTGLADRVRQGRVRAIVDGCGCAAGPTTTAWFRYRRGAFRVTDPPGGLPTCDARVLTAVAAKQGAGPAVFRRVACAYGWALAVGTSGRRHAAGLFEHSGYGWSLLAIADGRKRPPYPGSPGVFALPDSALRQMAARLGEPVGPILAAQPAPKWFLGG